MHYSIIYNNGIVIDSRDNASTTSVKWNVRCAQIVSHRINIKRTLVILSFNFNWINLKIDVCLFTLSPFLFTSFFRHCYNKIYANNFLIIFFFFFQLWIVLENIAPELNKCLCSKLKLNKISCLLFHALTLEFKN